MATLRHRSSAIPEAPDPSSVLGRSDIRGKPQRAWAHGGLTSQSTNQENRDAAKQDATATKRLCQEGLRSSGRAR